MAKFLYDLESYYRFRAPTPLTDMFLEGGEWRATCPFCHNPKQKFYVQPTTGKWYCHMPDCVSNNGRRGGGVIRFHALAKNISLEEARAELYYDEPSTSSTATPIINSQVWQDLHDTLLMNPSIIESMINNWKFSKDAIEHFKLGWDHSLATVTFPIFNKAGKCVNIRYKKLFVPSNYEGLKIWNYKGREDVRYGKARIYPEVLLDAEEELFWVMGEKDMVSTWSQGITNVVTVTSGESAWNPEWAFEIQGKVIHFIPDIDEPGIFAAKKHYYEHAKDICKASLIYLPKMPAYDTGKARKDITDFWLSGKNANDFLKLVPSDTLRPNYWDAGSGSITLHRTAVPTIWASKDQDDLEKLGSHSIIDEYVGHANDFVSSPTSYHRLCGLWLIGNLLGKNVTSVLGRDFVYPNLFCVLVGPTTIVHKSASTDFAVNTLTDVLPDAIASRAFTPEGLLAKLEPREGKNVCDAIYYDEIAQLFDQIKNREYMAVARDQLIRLYDGRKVTYDKSKESINLEQTFLTMLGSAVPTRLAEVLSWRDIESGFLGRFLIVLETQSTGFRPRDYEKTVQRAEHIQLVRKLRTIYKHWDQEWRIPLHNGTNEAGEVIPPYLSPKHWKDKAYRFRMRPDVLARFNQFEEACGHTDEVSRYEHVAMVHARLPMLLQKLMLIYAASDSTIEQYWNFAWIEMRHILLAIRDIDLYRRHMVDLVLQVGSSEIEHFIVQAYSFLFKKKRATRTEIAAKLKTDKRMMDNVMDTLKDRGMVIERRISDAVSEYMVAS